jgi:hypothetical protein
MAWRLQHASYAVRNILICNILMNATFSSCNILIRMQRSHQKQSCMSRDTSGGLCSEETLGVCSEETLGVCSEETLGVCSEETLGVCSEETLGVCTGLGDSSSEACCHRAHSQGAGDARGGAGAAAHNGDLRQAVVLGCPACRAKVAPCPP